MRNRFLAVLMAASLTTALHCAGSNEAQKSSKPARPPATPWQAQGEPITTRSGLKYWDIELGKGFEAQRGKRVKVHYSGYLMTGQKFDSSVDKGEALEFRLGEGRVIRGWDEGIAGMKIGGKRKLRIPPDLGYGSRGAGGGVIPPNAILTFDVELLDVR